MSTRIVTTLTDDLDPDIAAIDTVAFALDGMAYEIDLSAEHRDQMLAALQPFLHAARTPGSGPKPTRRPAAPATGTGEPTADGGAAPDAQTVRAWAKEHDIAVNERGRIKASIIVQFLEATR